MAAAAPARGAAGEMLLTDRGEYIKFLESQLDAVTQACLTAQSFGERIGRRCRRRLARREDPELARLIKCAQGVAEEQERAYHAAMERVHERVRRCEAAVARAADAENENVFADEGVDAKDWRTARLAIRTSSRTLVEYR